MSVNEGELYSSESSKPKKSGKSRFAGMMRGMGGYGSQSKKPKSSGSVNKKQRFARAIQGAFGSRD